MTVSPAHISHSLQKGSKRRSLQHPFLILIQQMSTGCSRISCTSPLISETSLRLRRFRPAPTWHTSSIIHTIVQIRRVVPSRKCTIVGSASKSPNTFYPTSWSFSHLVSREQHLTNVEYVYDLTTRRRHMQSQHKVCLLPYAIESACANSGYVTNAFIKVLVLVITCNCDIFGHTCTHTSACDHMFS